MKFKTEQTDQGENYVLPDTDPIGTKEALERRMKGPAKATKPQKAFEGTPLMGGLEPHQDELF